MIKPEMKFRPTKATLDYVIPIPDFEIPEGFPFGNIPIKRKETATTYKYIKKDINALW